MYPGYGPKGSLLSHQVTLLQESPGPMGTEYCFAFDQNSGVDRLLVSFPPNEKNWREKSLEDLSEVQAGLRGSLVLLPRGAAIIALRPLDASGKPIPSLCCMYRVKQRDWLVDKAPQRAVTEVSKENLNQEYDEIDARLYVKGRTFNCCMCGNVFPGSSGHQLRDLSRDDVNAIRLETTLSKAFPFICTPCYTQKIGLSQRAMGQATLFQGGLLTLIVLFFRALFGIFLVHKFKYSPSQVEIYLSAFFGTLFPIESIPTYTMTLLKTPLGMLAGLVAFLGCMVLGLMKPSLGASLLMIPLKVVSKLMFFLTTLPKSKWTPIAFGGALAAFLLGHLIGAFEDDDDAANAASKD